MSVTETAAKKHKLCKKGKQWVEITALESSRSHEPPRCALSLIFSLEDFLFNTRISSNGFLQFKPNKFLYFLSLLSYCALHFSPLSSIRDALVVELNSDRKDPELLPLTLISVLNFQIVLSTTLIIEIPCPPRQRSSTQQQKVPIDNKYHLQYNVWVTDNIRNGIMAAIGLHYS